MTAASGPPDEPYQQSMDYSWTEKAFEMLERDDLRCEVVCRVRRPCPRCRHELDDQQAGTAAPATPAPPAGQVGCGVSFSVELPGDAVTATFSASKLPVRR